MMRYRTLMLGVIALFLTGCAGYDYYDDGRTYGQPGYGTVHSAPYATGYTVQRYEVYSTPRYYRAPSPRYYAPPPPPRYYAPQHHRRPPIQQGWHQPPHGFYPGPGRGPERHHSRGRDDRRGDDHRDRGRDERRHRNR